MSTVRKCDLQRSPDCEDIFSELAEGWQSFQATTMKKDSNGRSVPVVQTLDACPSCAVLPPPSQAELEARDEKASQAARLRALENAVGMDPATGTFRKPTMESTS